MLSECCRCLNAVWMWSECCPKAGCMLAVCCLNAVWMLAVCCLNAVCMRSECCLNAGCMLSECSLYAVWMLSECCIYLFKPHDASNQHFSSLKNHLISRNLGIFKRKFLWNCFNDNDIFSFATNFKSSSSTTNRELRQQFAACNGWRWQWISQTWKD